MGGAKEQQIHQDDQREVAEEIALKAGVLKRCDAHPFILYGGSLDDKRAYQLGNMMFTNGDLKDEFEDRKELTDMIKAVILDNSSDVCSLCEKNLRDD